MKKMRNLLALLLCLAMVLGLAACGSSSSTSAASTETAAPAAQATETEAAETEAPAAEAAEPAAEETSAYDDDAVIVWGLISQWADLTPFDNGSGGYYSGIVNSMIYDKLVYCDNSGNISPRAADSWEVSDDKTVFTFHLNENATFHDGTPATAADWEFAARLLAAPDAGFSDHGAIAMVVGTNDAGDLVEGEEFGVKALDDWTLQITLKSAMNESTFLMTKAYYFTALPEHLLGNIPTADIATNEFFNAPIGSGPCCFDNLTAGELTLDRYENYYLGEAHYAKQVLKVMSASSLSTALLTGEIDIPFDTPASEEVEDLMGEENLYITLNDTTSNMMFLTFNNSVITDSRVRQAVNLAMNKQLIADNVYDGLAVPIESFLPYDSEYIPSDVAYAQNLEEAKSLLEAAMADGYDGKLTIGTPTGIRERICALVEQDLESIGFDIEVQTMEASAMFADLRSGADGQLDAGVVGYGVSPDPCGFNSFFDYRDVTFTSVTDPTYVEMMDNFVAATDDAEAMQIMQDYVRYIHDECPVCFIIAARSYMVTSARMGDIINDLNSIAMRDMACWNWCVSK